ARDVDDGREVEERGVVAEDVDAAEGLFDRRDRRVDGILPRDVEFDRHSGGVDRVRRLPRAREVDIGDGDPGALAHVSLREGAADAARGAGDEGGLAVEASHERAIPLSSKRWILPASGAMRSVSPGRAANSPLMRAVSGPTPSMVRWR